MKLKSILSVMMAVALALTAFSGLAMAEKSGNVFMFTQWNPDAPALNALIAAKEADCAERGLRLDTQIESSWSEVPIPGWELCRVFGNLIDNARDALTQVSSADGRIVVFLGEKPGSFVFEVRNNGPEIPADLIGRIFESGFSTKAEGRGNGLAIVREILSGYGGSISVSSDMNQTCFSGTIPRAQMP